MNNDSHGKVDKEDKPLTRTDVERFLLEAGSSDKLNLSGRNLEGINLTLFSLQGADLSGANLSGADLSGADLSKADLHEADLFRANLSGANLSGANLYNAILAEAILNETNLSEADLLGANLREASLHGANLYESDFRGTVLFGARFYGADLFRTILSEDIDTRESDLRESDLRESDLRRAIFGRAGRREDILKATALDEPKVAPKESTSTFRIRILEEPLTARNLATITSALTQLHTQCWLIATDRFADLIEYTQTHSSSFDVEANLTIAQLTHHSPAEIKLNVSLEGVANALKTAIDAVMGMWERKRELELKNIALEEEIRRKKQEVETTLTNGRIAQQKALVELYDSQIELRRKQLDLLDYAAEKAPKIVEALRPEADTTIKAMAANTLVTSILQLGETKGLELLPSQPNSGPPPHNSEEKTVRPENG